MLFGDGFDGLIKVVVFAVLLLVALTTAAGVAYAILHQNSRKGVHYQSE